MGTHLLPFLTSFTITPSLPLITNPNNPRFSYTIRCRSSRSGGPHWNSNAETIRTGRSRFNFDDEFFTDDEEDEDDEFGFTGSAKQRTWWSDDTSEIDDDEDEKYWIFKVFRAFGWMLPAIVLSMLLGTGPNALFMAITLPLGRSALSLAIDKVFGAIGWMLPAIIISMLLGTGPNALFMAIALPLGQSALSLAIDKVWGRTSNSPKPRPRSRTKKKPFTRAASNIRTSETEQEENIETGKERGSYPSWVASHYRSVKKGDKSASSFGGWDELDKQGGTNKIPKRVPIQKADGPPKRQKKGKLSRRSKNRDTPLLTRLLIAFFPFLGSWTRWL